MPIGVGAGSPDAELKRLGQLKRAARPIESGEFRSRIGKARALMEEHGYDAVYLSAGSNLFYFTGTRWNQTERLAGAVITQGDGIDYLVPHFEMPTFRQHMQVDGELHGWHEHESPFALLCRVLAGNGIARGKIGLDESTPFHHAAEIMQAARGYEIVDARPVTAGCRTRKSAAELSLIQTAMYMTLEVHKSAAAILKEGIAASEVKQFIDRAHRAIGASGGSYFCAVQYGEATAYPHGVPHDQVLQPGDMVLIDTGCCVENYHSDITRCYVFGEASEKQRKVWDTEKAAQAVAFEAARPGARCGDVDDAVRRYLDAEGYGPGYQVPGLPHRTGHGIGLDIHEWPYLVSSDDTPLAPGMCFSNEPMLCLYGEFGVRLEDHFYMTDTGPRWFTAPSASIDDPFGMAA